GQSAVAPPAAGDVNPRGVGDPDGDDARPAGGVFRLLALMGPDGIVRHGVAGPGEITQALLVANADLESVAAVAVVVDTFLPCAGPSPALIGRAGLRQLVLGRLAVGDKRTRVNRRELRATLAGTRGRITAIARRPGASRAWRCGARARRQAQGGRQEQRKDGEATIHSTPHHQGSTFEQVTRFRSRISRASTAVWPATH